jgi:hypothetical protein
MTVVQGERHGGRSLTLIAIAYIGMAIAPS